MRIFFLVCLCIFAFVGISSYTAHKENIENSRIEELEEAKMEKQRLKDSISSSIAKEKFEANACYFCKKQRGAIAFGVLNDTTFKKYPNKKGFSGRYCSIECCKGDVAEMQAQRELRIERDEYDRTHSDDSNNEVLSNPVLDRADEDSNPNRTTCPQCNGIGFETGGIVNGQQQQMRCRMCKGTGRGHY